MGDMDTAYPARGGAPLLTVEYILFPSHLLF